MSRVRKGQDIHGILLLDKPAGITSNSALQTVRRQLHARKGGHCGSLDPFATGMLPLCFGEASKTAAYMLGASKIYLATARLGLATNTGDVDGEVQRKSVVPALTREGIDAALRKFTGPITQVPPMYSALKHEGRPLYALARKGIDVPRQPREVIIHALECLSWEAPLLSFKVHCSKGTYIRTLAEDICAALGTCGHLRSLRRLWVEPFAGEPMIALAELESAVAAGKGTALLLPIDAGLQGWPRLELEPARAERFRQGNPVTAAGPNPGRVRVYADSGRILGLAELRADGKLHPKRVFVYSPPVGQEAK